MISHAKLSCQGIAKVKVVVGGLVGLIAVGFLLNLNEISYRMARLVGSLTLSASRADKNIMSDGDYVLTTNFSGKSEAQDVIGLKFIDARLVSIRGIWFSNIEQSGNRISWVCGFPDDSHPAIVYDGVIDGNVIRGKVYSEPGRGWTRGVRPEYGDWSLRKTEINEKPQSSHPGLFEVILNRELSAAVNKK